jgi:hypothetical protein
VPCPGHLRCVHLGVAAVARALRRHAARGGHSRSSVTQRSQSSIHPPITPPSLPLTHPHSPHGAPLARSAVVSLHLRGFPDVASCCFCSLALFFTTFCCSPPRLCACACSKTNLFVIGRNSYTSATFFKLSTPAREEAKRRWFCVYSDEKGVSVYGNARSRTKPGEPVGTGGRAVCVCAGVAAIVGRRRRRRPGVRSQPAARCVTRARAGRV